MKRLFIGQNRDTSSSLLDLKMCNRHGLIAGATGTGKTVTLQVLAEQFSEAGVPVFATDIKGDLSGIGAPGEFNPGLIQRATEIGLDPYTPQQYPVKTWDIMGQQGTPLRATVKDMGPLLLARLLNLTTTQAGVLNVVFMVADKENMPLNSLTDFKKVLQYCVEHAQAVSTEYGYLSASTVGIVIRGVTSLEMQGGNEFFGIPEFDVHDLLTTRDGMGTINLLAAEALMGSPQIYAAFIMWLMQKLFQVLPEVGDPDKPKLVFFFDEAHLLFKDAPKPLLDTVERVVRLIRSKGVGVYFVTQSPNDVPDAVLGQLGNRFQHALRAFTPKDQRAVRAAADTFRTNPAFRTSDEITSLGKGMALVSTLAVSGTPSMVEVVKIRPPRSKIGPIPRTVREEPLIPPVPSEPPSAEPTPVEVASIVILSVFVFGIAVGVGLILVLGWVF